MNIKTVHMSDLFKQCEDIYTSVMIVAKRAKQIIDERVVPIDENEEVEDTIEFERPINEVSWFLLPLNAPDPLNPKLASFSFIKPNCTEGI